MTKPHETIYPPITDWDDAYSNGAHIPNGERWPEAWIRPAADFRTAVAGELDIAYGAEPRAVYDLFQPAGKPKGLFVFIHGGYWVKLDKTYWSHLAAGARDAGWAVAIPSYTLCPQATVMDITQMIASFLEQAAARVAGPIIVSGHSAGGHLAAMMACNDTALDTGVADRLAHIVSISGVHDLRPLLQTTIKNDLRLDEHSAEAVSPVLKVPRKGTRLTTWVGADERPEFLRQSGLLSNLWHGLGAKTRNIEEPARHHMDVIDGLMDKDSALMQTILQEG